MRVACYTEAGRSRDARAGLSVGTVLNQKNIEWQKAYVVHRYASTWGMLGPASSM